MISGVALRDFVVLGDQVFQCVVQVGKACTTHRDHVHNAFAARDAVGKSRAMGDKTGG
jgi:hypothetical protein